jgi:hypothetical protein
VGEEGWAHPLIEECERRRLDVPFIREVWEKKAGHFLN